MSRRDDGLARVAWGVGAWSVLVPVAGIAWIQGSSSASVLVTIGLVLLGGLLGKFVALPIVLGKFAWWALRSLVATLRRRPGPAFDGALRLTRRDAGLSALVSTPLVLGAGAVAGLVAGLWSGVSAGKIAGFAAFAWLGLVGPSVAAALGWLPAEAAFLVLLVAAFGDDDGDAGPADTTTTDRPRAPPEPLQPAAPLDALDADRRRSNESSTRSSPKTNSSA